MQMLSSYSSDDLEKVLLNDNVVHITNKFLSNKKMPHALIFSGNEWVGKLHNAFFFAKKLLSYNPEDSSMEHGSTNLFGENESPDFTIKEEVGDLVDNISHPDLFYIYKGKDPEENKNISVKQIRALEKFLSLTPSQASYRVAIINSVDEMNNNACNALLKTLEEPSDNTVIILICHNKHRVSDTIKSRCVTLDFKNIPDERFFRSDLISEIGREDLEKVQKISNNNPFVAKEILSGQVLSIYEEFTEIIEEENISMTKLSSLSRKITEDKSRITEKNFYKLLLSEEKNNAATEKQVNNWFALHKLIREKDKANLDTKDCLKEIIRLKKYI